MSTPWLLKYFDEYHRTPDRDEEGVRLWVFRGDDYLGLVAGVVTGLELWTQIPRRDEPNYLADRWWPAAVQWTAGQVAIQIGGGDWSAAEWTADVRRIPIVVAEVNAIADSSKELPDYTVGETVGAVTLD